MSGEILMHKYYIEQFYASLKGALEKDKKYRSSVIVSMFDMNSNKRMNILKDSALKAIDIPPDVLNDFLEDGYVRQGAEAESYVLTAKGAWLFERDAKILDEDKLIRSIDKKFFFSEDIEKKLKDREKMVVLSLIAIRAFSRDSVVDLADSIRLEHWGNVIKGCCEMLGKLKVVNTRVDEIMEHKGNEHPVYNLMRHLDAIPRKTRGIYQPLGNQRYFLDVTDGPTLSTERLSYLFWRVLEDKLSFENEKIVLEFCDRIAYDECVYLFDVSRHVFAVPRYDDMLKEAFESGCLNRSVWEKQE
jgi:hypothetical protein